MPPRGGASQPGVVEAVGQQLAQRERLALTLAVEADDLQLRGKLHHHLTARAAGDAVVLAAPGDGDADEVAAAFAHGLEDGGALGADGHAIGGVFNVAAGKDGAVTALKRRPHRDVGIR